MVSMDGSLVCGMIWLLFAGRSGAVALLSKRLIDRHALSCKHLRPRFRNVQAVLQAYPELAVDRDHRLIAEAHPRLQFRLVALHEVRPLVPVEPESVAGAMRQTRHLVPGTETGVGNDLARRRV